MKEHKKLEEAMDALKRENAPYRTMEYYRLFTILCMKYFFFNEEKNWGPEEALECLTDGPGDGGIDAVFNDPFSESNDVVIIQSKYYQDTSLKGQDIAGELYKIKETVQAIDQHKVQNLNEKVVSAYRNAKDQMEENGNIRVAFFTSYEPKDKRERNRLEKLNREIFSSFDFEMNFRSEIEAQMETIESGKLFIESDKLELDKANNALKYEDSMIVNISARSLQELQNRRGNGLLGMNLRYYVRQKMVDDGIRKTITTEPENFWYKNNGIIVICDRFECSGKVLRLYNFSIINGGQTTNRIGRLDIERDFYLPCKVVKVKGEKQNERDHFTSSIAESSNAQKPVKKADLKANTPEQLRLHERLKKNKVYYITKKGDKVPKQYGEPYQSATLEQVGKIGLAMILQMPGSARNNSQRMYQDEYYYQIFGMDAPEGVLADGLKIAYYYDLFRKSDLRQGGYDEKTVIPLIRNGKMFQMAAVAFLCKIAQGVLAYEEVERVLDNTDELKRILLKIGGMKQIILGKIENEKEVFFKIFGIIGDEVLGYCFENALERMEKDTLIPSNYLKGDINYYKDVLKRLWRIYNRNKELKESIGQVCGKL